MQHKIHKNGHQTKEKEGINLQLFAKYLAYWPLFVISLFLAMAYAFVYLRVTIPQFEADATIIIKDEKKGSDDSKLIESLEPVSAKKIIENEVEVLQSRSLANTVVKNLHLYAPVTQEGKIKKVSAYLLSPVTVEVENPDGIVSDKNNRRIDFKFDSAQQSVLINKTFAGALNTWIKTPYGTLKFIHNVNYVPGASEQKPLYFSLYNTKDVSAAILGGLKVYPSSKLSSVIELSYRDEVPKRAEDILNELIYSYTNAALVEKNVLAKNTLAFIEERLSIVSKDLDSIELKLQKFKTSQGAVDISRQGQLYIDNVSTNEKRLNEINMQDEALAQLEAYASSKSNAGALPSTLGITDPTLAQQMNSLNTLQMKYEQLKPTVAENNPILQAVVNQINQIKPTILTNIESQRKNLALTKSSVSSSGTTYSGMLSAIPQKERQMVEILRDQNIKNGIYSFLLQKREDSELALASSISDSKVVNYAQSSGSPVSPKRMVIYVMAIAIGLGLPIAFITARELFSPKILYRTEIESLTGIPIVGEIGYSKTKELMVVQPGKRTIAAEEFRKLRVSLLSLGINAGHKKILVTSSISGEGKSFIAANLATSISLTGKKVLLMDIDLHNPGLGKFFNIKESVGLSDYLIKKKDLSQIIYHIPGNEHLFYISSGTLQPDSSELLENGRIQTLLQELDEQFDMIVIDSAPIVLITDAYLLSSLCDATLYVVRHKVTPKVLIKRIDQNDAVNPIKNPAIIFNGVKARGFFKNNYGYGYNNYVYGYGAEKK